MENKIVTPVTKGLILSLVMILVSLAIYTAGEANNKAVSWLPILPFLGGVIWGCIYYGDQMKGNVTYGNVFSHGFKTTAVVIIIMLVYTLIAMTLLFPDMIETALQTAQMDMEKQGKLSDEQIQTGMNMARKFIIPGAIAGVVFSYGIIGAIASAIGAAIAKKNPQTPFQSQN